MQCGDRDGQLLGERARPAPPGARLTTTALTPTPAAGPGGRVPRQPAAPASTFVQCDTGSRASTMAARQPASRMIVTPTEKQLIRSTWAAVEPIQDVASDL